MMKAIGQYQPLPLDHPESLVDLDLPMPEATGCDLLVRVQAIAVNPIDTKVRKRALSDNGDPRILGWDAAGEVVAAGAESTLFKPGDRVFYSGELTRPGCNAEYQLVDERIVGRMPASLDFAQAAALPLTAVTAWESLFDRLGIVEDAAANRDIAVAFTGMALIMRVTRNNMLEELGKPYVMTLRAKGLPERVVIWKHVFRNALHPLVTMFGQVLAFLINGFAITSAVLNLPTIQSIYLSATFQQDIFLAGAILILIAITVMVGNLISDVMLAWLDPRVRYD